MPKVIEAVESDGGSGWRTTKTAEQPVQIVSAVP
jgi:hypothetical protein